MSKSVKIEKLPILVSRATPCFLLSHTYTLEIGRDLSKEAIQLSQADPQYDNKIIVAQQYEMEQNKPYKQDDIAKKAMKCEIVSVNISPSSLDNNNPDLVVELKVLENVELNLSKKIDKKNLVVDFQSIENELNEQVKHIVDDEDSFADLISCFDLAKSIKNIPNLELFKQAAFYLKNQDYRKAIDYLATCLFKDDYLMYISYIESDGFYGRILTLKEYIFKNLDNVNEVKREVDSEINRKLQELMTKQQKEFYLREKLKIIKEELGDISNREDESDAIRKRLKLNPYPKNIKEKILVELAKYETAMTSNESSLIKSYIDWLLDLPWWQMTETEKDLVNVQKVLEKNHYGIQKVKDRIIEHIAVTLNNPNSKAPIICLAGPPGVGKTSLAKSIAEALNKEFVKISLGGVKDEAEIRGHRKTYLGAMPGRIIKAMKRAKVINPVFLLDEIDKMGSDYKGDPASAMLEVLDPEQNKTFSDNYIEEDYDLSKVMFICTANYINQIPYALLDRLELIELSSYTINEKIKIAKNYLVKRVLKDANLKEKDIKFSTEAIEFIINYYTRESGVRELERLLQQIVRKVLVLKMNGEEYPDTIKEDEVLKFLGKKRYDITLKNEIAIPGVVNGMAYTSAGGDLLPIEATFFKGKGNIVITGNLEKTMNESVNVAYGYVKSNLEKFGINDVNLSELDLHLHVPAGGVPKDGPSAGVTITTAIISALKKQVVDNEISMTGEIMLRGKVGIIGGVKEKVISAHRAGVRKIFLPKDDERFLEDIPNEILKELKIFLVTEYQQIYNEIFK